MPRVVPGEVVPTPKKGAPPEVLIETMGVAVVLVAIDQIFGVLLLTVVVDVPPKEKINDVEEPVAGCIEYKELESAF